MQRQAKQATRTAPKPKRQPGKFDHVKPLNKKPMNISRQQLYAAVRGGLIVYPGISPETNEFGHDFEGNAATYIAIGVYEAAFESYKPLSSLQVTAFAIHGHSYSKFLEIALTCLDGSEIDGDPAIRFANTGDDFHKLVVIHRDALRVVIDYINGLNG